MGKFKDIHGQTRVGKFLRSIKKSGILGKAIDAAGSLATGDVLGALKDILVEDTSISPEERSFALEELRLDIEREKSITRRWNSDLKYGNILTKSIRPVILLILTLSFVIGFFMGTYDMNIIGDLLTIVLSGYFVMRTGDKIFGQER